MARTEEDDGMKGKRVLAMALLLGLATLLGTGCGSPKVDVRPVQPTAAATPISTALPAASPVAVVPVDRTPGQGSASTPSTATPMATAPITDVEAAVQTALDYFDAINRKDYARAYSYWARGGLASGQSPEGFARGYADTVRVSVLLGMPSSQGTGAARQTTVPVTLMSVVNLPDHAQKVQHYEGTYALRPSDASGVRGWEIAAASVAEVTAGPLPPAATADPTTLLRSYFDAINLREFARAYSYWDDLGHASQQGFALFEQGFATTRQVKVDLGTPQQNAGAGNVYADVPVTMVATQDDGSIRTYSGTYTAHRANVPPFEQLGWRIEGAKVSQTAGSSAP